MLLQGWQIHSAIVTFLDLNQQQSLEWFFYEQFDSSEGYHVYYALAESYYYKHINLFHQS